MTIIDCRLFSYPISSIKLKKNFLLIVLAFFMYFISSGQVYTGQLDQSKLPTSSFYYQHEYTFDTTIRPEAWAKEHTGMHVSFASTDSLYFRTEVPGIEKETMSWNATGWKGERINTQVLIWSPDTLQQIRIKVSDLKSSNGKVISKTNIRSNLIRYVVSNYPFGERNAVCGEGPDKNLYLLPDRFEPFERFDLPGKSVRPVWISIDLPQQAEAGLYNGTIKVICANYSKTLQMQVTVQKQVLPKPHEWKYRLDLWQNPSIISSYYGVKLWSEDFKSLLKKHLKLYADAGGKFITANVVHSVWADTTYASLVEWIKTKTGSWRFDYTHFDEYVHLAMQAGVDKSITIYSPIPYGESFRYLDEATGEYVYDKWPTTSEIFRTNWTAFLSDLKKHLEKKGWLDKTFIGINENAPEQTLAAIKMVKNHSSTWKITYAGDWHPELDTLLDDYCVLYGKEPDTEAVKRRSAKGLTTTYYVCCTPAYPNNFVFSPPIEGRWISWHTMAHGYDGFLRWAYDTWPPDVMNDARNMHWTGGAGDCFMVYPGANSSIRFEKLREGIVDYEKIRIIRIKASRSADVTVKKLVQQLEQNLQTFNIEKEFKEDKLRSDIRQGLQLINALSERLP